MDNLQLGCIALVWVFGKAFLDYPLGDGSWWPLFLEHRFGAQLQHFPDTLI